MINRSLSLLAFCLVFLTLSASAQSSSVYDEPDETYRKALELFNKQQYGAAKKLFLQIATDENTVNSETKANALFYTAASAFELFNADAELYFNKFIDGYSTHPRLNAARFYLGNLKYRDRKYKDAVDWYNEVGLRNLPQDQKDEYLFKKGYSHLMVDDLQNARQLMFEIKDPSSQYYPPASYYYGHIAYMQGDYQTALGSFEKLIDDRNFGPVVPYYITHIFFLQEKYDSLLAFAPALLEEANPKRAPEISRLIGEAYFIKGNYQEALPYLEKYVSNSPSGLTRQDHYQIGFTYYSNKNFEKAIRHFEKVTSLDDILSQNAFFHLASCYLETGQKRFARNAFYSAFQKNFDEEIAQEALFNYAKTSLELSLDPYNEAIISFQRYISEYPQGKHIEEAYSHLVDLFQTTRNYKDALASIEKIQVNSRHLRSAYQRIAYYRGVELFNNGDFKGAIVNLKKSRKYPESKALSARSLFWEAEANYRLDQYDDAIAAYEKFLISPGAFTLPVFERAYYSLGYSYFKKDNYNKAITEFRKFINSDKQDKVLLNDAYLRTADCYFISKNYPLSLEYYDKAIKQDAIDTDYAFFQKGLVLGVMGQFEKKNNTLQNFINKFPESNYIVDAKFEIANTYLLLDNPTQARRYFQQVINDHPNSSYVKNSLLKTGLIHFNLEEDQQAIKVFKDIINKYPGSAESHEALASLRNIYVNLDQVDEYFNFTKGLDFANVTTAQQDSLTYMAAENRYMEGDCQNATKSFQTYLEKFPRGIFSINANFYKAECEFRLNDYQKALEGYLQVIERPRSRFTENALSRVSYIEFNLNNMEAAYNYYKQLEQVAESRSNIVEAHIGQMRTLYRLDRNEEAIEAAQQVTETEKVPQDIMQEAYLIQGNAQLALNELQDAYQSFSRVVELAENENSAQALYYLALIKYRQGNYAEAEKNIFDNINKITAYDYWLAKTFILLADVYVETGNLFQAKHTLNSIISNYKGEELVKQAEDKLQKILVMEKESEQNSEPDTLEIDLGNSSL